MDPVKQQVINSSNAMFGFEEFLLHSGKIDNKKLSQLSIKSRGSGQYFIESLLQNKIINEEELTQLRAEYYRLPYIDLKNFKITKEMVATIPQSAIAMYKFVPFGFDGKVLKVAITDPADLTSLEALEFLAQKKHFIVEIYLSSITSFKNSISQNKDISLEVRTALEDIAKKEKEISARQQEQRIKTDKAAQLITEAPISKIVDVMIKHAIEARASDIHIEPSEHDLRVRYRVDGVLQSSLIIPKSVHPAIISRIKILSNLKIDETRLPQDGRFHMQFGKISVDFRVSTLPTVNGEKIVLRILDKTAGVPTLDDLGIWNRQKAKVEENLKKPHGMVLVTGPTGSGKSTTLSSVLSKLNKVGINIVTLEDLVEYFLEGVNQAQVKPEIGLTFASGLRSILRQDPNVVMVGEIRDSETAELAVHAALTGHLVFSTLHTNDAVGAVPRLVDMGVDNFLLVASLNLVLAQRLVRKLCPECKKKVPVLEDIKKDILEELKNVPKDEMKDVDLNNISLWRGEGCNACGSSGYKGRIGIFEALSMSKSIQALVADKEPVSKILDQALKEGMVTMKQDGYIKVLLGVTSLEEVLRVTKV